MRITQLIRRLNELAAHRGDAAVLISMGGGDNAPLRVGSADTERDPLDPSGNPVVVLCPAANQGMERMDDQEYDPFS